MSASVSWERVRALFQAALERAPEERAGFVALQADEPGIRDEVMSLLALYPAAEAFLDRPVDGHQVAEACAHLQIGERLGAFHIIELIGSGGMGEVYRARDLRLDRDVAIKVLSGDADDAALQRDALEREARAVARLSHPRIATLHDVGYASVRGLDTAYLVMELVEGETLAARLRRGRLPIDQCLSLACDVAEALVAAHAAGLVHRDLKPGNVMLTRSGAKLLDFGVAVARLSTAPAARSHLESAHPIGPIAVAGTPPYMSPEQLRGAVGDTRSDLFAFGALLYEMISGHRAFGGATAASVASEVIETPVPSLVATVPEVPLALDRLVATCLAKDPDERWQTARDLLRELRWIREDRSHRAAATRPDWRRSVLIAAGAGVTLLALAFFGLRTRSAAVAERVSFAVYPAAGTTLPRGTADMALAPDGSRLVFVALDPDGRRRLWLRTFDAIDLQSIDGSDDASDPFWSPDGRWIGFFAKGKLKRIASAGGLPQDVCDVTAGARGGAWNRDGTILFAATGQPVERVAASGGVPVPVTSLAASDLMHMWPVFLPDGRSFLYLNLARDPARTAIYQGSLDSATVRRVENAESRVGVAGGRLVSVAKGLLLSRAYDARSAQVGDNPITIARGIQQDSPLRSGGAFSISSNSVVAFRSASPNSRFIWFDRSGRQLSEFPERADFHHPWLSPDEKHLLAEKTDPASGRHGIWALDMVNGTTSRLFSDPAGAHGPIWSPDGTRVSFSSNRLGGVDLFEIPTDRSGAEHLVLSSKDGALQATDWSSDGRMLLYTTQASGSWDLLLLRLSPAAAPEPFMDTPAMEKQGHFSPDVRWVAYVSDESGTPQVYVRRLHGAAESQRVSLQGGAQPRWRADGKELFYLAPDGMLLAVAVRTAGDRLEFGTPRKLFNTRVVSGHLDRRNQYLVTRDGQRVLVNLSDEDENAAPITVVKNWDK